MKISDFEKQYVIKTRLDFAGTDAYIVLREPTEDELLEFSQFDKDETKLTKHILNNLVPACLVEHNFTDDSDKPLNKADVVKLISKSGKKMQSTIKTWFDSFSNDETEDDKKK